MTEAELVADAHAIIGEGPWWDSRDLILYWIDVKGKRLHVFDPAKGTDRSVVLGSMPGLVVGRSSASRSSASLLLAMERGFAFMDSDTGATTPIYDPEADMPGNRFNDGKCDARGRLWAGTMADSEKGRTGSLYLFDPDLSCIRCLNGVGISNGIAWSSDNRVMYYIDSPLSRVDAFDFDLETGSLSGRRVAFDVPRSMGFPDGMTIDEEGMLWVALWEGWGLGRWDPRSGKLIEKVDVPVARTSSCVFGGSNQDKLYITTAKVDLGPDGQKEQPHAGGLFVFEPGIRGASSVPFAG